MSNTKIKKILGLDLGSNSIGWALLENKDGRPQKIIDLGSRIFTKAVEDKTPTPKNVNRRESRLTRRVLQRRSRRKQRMLNYLISLDLLPKSLRDNPAPEIILNTLGDPYELRAVALDKPLEKHQLGRVFLHFVQRRGFLSNRKTILGDLVDDPDVTAVLAEAESEEDTSTEQAKEETVFKKQISVLRQTILETLAPQNSKSKDNKCRTLGEYLYTIKAPLTRRNRTHSGGELRTDRQMYRDELDLIWKQQATHHTVLNEDVKEQIEEIIFLQRPLKLRSDRIGKCSLEPKKNRISIARLEYQCFRYLQDVNNLEFMLPSENHWTKLNEDERQKLILLFESKSSVSFTEVKKTLDLNRNVKINLEEGGNKKFKGNVTASAIRKVIPEWDNFDSPQQLSFVEDMLSIQKKSTLKKRLTGHWNLNPETAVQLCMLEFEPGHGNLSLKAINKLLPYLERGMLFNEARVEAGYGYETEQTEAKERLGMPPETSNPIVNKGLHELRRLVNAIISEYGKPDVIRIEMARDLEMNTKRYKANETQQTANTKANEKATEAFQEIGSKNPQLGLRHYPSHTDKLKYRLWLDQEKRCAYSNQCINLTSLFTGEVEIDHILPYSQSLDDSFMNKVVCLTSENRNKGQRTPVDAFSTNPEKWEQIKQAIFKWGKKLKSKQNRFFMSAAEVQKRDFISSQLNDTRYMSRVALDYLKQLGADITTCKGITTSHVRHWWGLNNLLGETDKKDRTDHRHHAIDAVVIATIDRGFYNKIVSTAKSFEESNSALSMNDLVVNPPWSELRNDLDKKLGTVIVAHVPNRKLSGALHKDTGVGFIKGKGTVYRKLLNSDMTVKRAEEIIDPHVRALVIEHLSQFENDPKKAFAEGVKVFHKDGKTLIKRVRVLQSKEYKTLEKLEKSKFGVRDHQGKLYKWFAYGNNHHVEIVRNRNTRKVRGIFVTMMEASHRAKGIGNNVKVPKQPTVKTDHGPDTDFLMDLHINDLVSVEQEGERKFYRVQALERDGKKLELRLHTAATDQKPEEGVRKAITTLVNDFHIQKHSVNSIGKIRNDKTHSRH
ncbi:MAG: type II CRISPR RNA-guided endonuclease Cas9 [Deltaproteobacteria bacterium]|nr:type II CRISPR RNA-guided endonuclease Cas9 [Deltaproteobacteria bacterium]